MNEYGNEEAEIGFYESVADLSGTEQESPEVALPPKEAESDDNISNLIDFEDSVSHASKDSWQDYFPDIFMKNDVKKTVDQSKKKRSKWSITRTSQRTTTLDSLVPTLMNCVELQPMRPDFDKVVGIIVKENNRTLLHIGKQLYMRHQNSGSHEVAPDVQKFLRFYELNSLNRK